VAMEIKAFFILIEWAKATFWLLTSFRHCWCLSEAAPTIFGLYDWLVNADSYRQQTIGNFL